MDVVWICNPPVPEDIEGEKDCKLLDVDTLFVKEVPGSSNASSDGRTKGCMELLTPSAGCGTSLLLAVIVVLPTVND